MRNNILFFVCLIFVFVNAGCKSQQAVKEEASQKALLWKIEGKNLKQPSYLFGTIHMIPEADYFLPQGTLAAIENSKAMFFEIDMAEMSDMTALMGILPKVFMKDGMTLEKLLTKDDYAKVKSYFSEMGLPMMMVDKMKPMFLSAFAMVDMKPGDMGKSIKSYEMEFYEMAQSKKLKTGGLESIEFQLNIFDKIPYEDQAKMLIESLSSTNKEDDEFKKMVGLYKNQDIQALIKEMKQGEQNIANHEDLLINSRNQNWIPQIAKQSAIIPTFYAVGAGHLGGEMGVINLLRKAGFKVSPLSNTK